MMATVNLGTLELDPLLLIFEYLVATSPSAARCLAATNHYLHAAGRLVNYQTSTLTYDGADDEAMHERLTQWLADDSILRGIRNLTVQSRDPTSHERRNVRPDWSTLCHLVRRLSNLRNLVWTYHGHIPAQLLEALRAQPNAKLKIFRWTRNNDYGDHEDEDEIALSQCPALVSLQAVFAQDPDPVRGKVDRRQAAFCRIVAHAPALQHASIVNFVDRQNNRRQRRAEIPFHTHAQPNGALRSVTLDGFPISAQTINELASFVDVESLESLKLSRGPLELSYFDRAPTSLKHLSLNLGGVYHGFRWEVPAAASEYIQACSSLRSLSLWSWAEIDLRVILVHGPTLENLQLHEKDSFEPRRVLTLEELRDIQTKCTRLRELTIDLNRHWERLDAADHAAIFAVLSDMNLQKVQLYHDLETAGSDSFDLELDGGTKRLKAQETYVQEVWKLVFGIKSGGERALDVKFGEWERKIRVIDEQPVFPRTFFQVRPGDRIGTCEITSRSKSD